jgi:hypothetical protein
MAISLRRNGRANRHSQASPLHAKEASVAITFSFFIFHEARGVSNSFAVQSEIARGKPHRLFSAKTRMKRHRHLSHLGLPA